MIITEVKKVKIERACEPYVYLRWENDYGGTDYYCFKGNIVDMPSVSKQVYFDKQIDDLLNVTSNFEIVSKQYDEAIRCAGTFSKVNTEGMKQLLRSKNIEMCHDGDWLTVDIVPEQFQSERNKLLGRIRFKLILNRTYIK